MKDLPYGGRRVTAAPHKHGVHACRTRPVHALWVVLEGSARELPLTVYLPDGRQAMALFSSEEASTFCHFCEEGASLNIRQTTAGEVLSLLYQTSPITVQRPH